MERSCDEFWDLFSLPAYRTTYISGRQPFSLEQSWQNKVTVRSSRSNHSFIGRKSSRRPEVIQSDTRSAKHSIVFISQFFFGEGDEVILKDRRMDSSTDEEYFDAVDDGSVDPDEYIDVDEREYVDTRNSHWETAANINGAIVSANKTNSGITQVRGWNYQIREEAESMANSQSEEVRTFAQNVLRFLEAAEREAAQARENGRLTVESLKTAMGHYVGFTERVRRIFPEVISSEDLPAMPPTPPQSPPPHMRLKPDHLVRKQDRKMLKAAKRERERQERAQTVDNHNYMDEWATPVVPVVKRDGSIRLCGDYRCTVNKSVKPYTYPLPTVNEVLSTVAGGKCFQMELQAFLGLLNFYGSFLKRRSDILEPLHKLLQKDVPWEWTAEHEEAYKASKGLLTTDDLLVHYDEKLPLILTSDASSYGLGSVLSHLLPNGKEAPVAYYSRTMTKTERNYSQTDKEALAILAGVKKFHSYLLGRRFRIVTDHRPLLGIFNSTKPIPQMISPRVLRWSLSLQAYDYELEYRKGKDIANADALSRLPVSTPEFDVPQPADILLLESDTQFQVDSKLLAVSTKRDPVLSRTALWVSNGWPDHSPDERFQPYFKRRHELSIHQDCLLWGSRVIVPEKLQDEVLSLLHAGHPDFIQGLPQRYENAAEGYSRPEETQAALEEANQRYKEAPENFFEHVANEICAISQEPACLVNAGLAELELEKAADDQERGNYEAETINLNVAEDMDFEKLYHFLHAPEKSARECTMLLNNYLEGKEATEAEVQEQAFKRSVCETDAVIASDTQFSSDNVQEQAQEAAAGETEDEVVDVVAEAQEETNDSVSETAVDRACADCSDDNFHIAQPVTIVVSTNGPQIDVLSSSTVALKQQVCRNFGRNSKTNQHEDSWHKIDSVEATIDVLGTSLKGYKRKHGRQQRRKEADKTRRLHRDAARAASRHTAQQDHLNDDVQDGAGDVPDGAYTVFRRQFDIANIVNGWTQEGPVTVFPQVGRIPTLLRRLQIDVLPTVPSDHCAGGALRRSRRQSNKNHPYRR
ncbi:hypothetical protein JTE90_024682 [Oedothorax gibbosus]|uniref:RNA-directed DNA polymerase n=1 Tax=Oedothorax gibbosus TaxID=931172 RepID=A0AAV6TTG5_9ARAC|nr:hypothetical protein JTE90_024682 [Oedothorax gibbosus]